MNEFYCINCGRPIRVYTPMQKYNYYSTFNCLDCLKIEHEGNGESLELDIKIVYNSWIKRLSLMNDVKNKDIEIYNPLTGEKINNLGEYLLRIT